MAPDDRISIREDSQYHYGVWDGQTWLGTFLMFRDASEFAAKQTIAKEQIVECEYCKKQHDRRIACPEYIAAKR